MQPGFRGEGASGGGTLAAKSVPRNALTRCTFDDAESNRSLRQRRIFLRRIVIKFDLASANAAHSFPPVLGREVAQLSLRHRRQNS